jgi:hypothetical protein
LPGGLEPRRLRHHQKEPPRLDNQTARRPYAMTQASYDLARLRGNRPIKRIGGANTY